MVFWATGGSLGCRYRVEIYLAAATIVAAEIVTGIRADLRGPALVRQTLVGAVFGLLVIALRLLLDYRCAG